MVKQTCRTWLALLGFALMAVFSSAANATMSGIDHLADNLSVTDFWVDGAGGFQAGNGGRSAPGPELPDKWRPGLTVHVVWEVRDWEHDTGSRHESDVPVDPYKEDGNLWVHFLADGTVRVVVSNVGPYASNYPGPHDAIPRKKPWDMYPPRIAYSDVSEQFLDTQLIHKRCDVGPDPTTCVKKAHEKLLDEERADARRYLPRCASITTGYLYDECQRQARLSMQAARWARRCQAVPDLPECGAQKAGRQINKAAEAVEDSNQ